MPVIDDEIVEDVQYFQLLLRSSLEQIEAVNDDPITVYIEDNDSESTHAASSRCYMLHCSYVTVCLVYEESVQRSFEVYVNLLSVMGVFQGIGAFLFSPPFFSSSSLSLSLPPFSTLSHLPLFLV